MTESDIQDEVRAVTKICTSPVNKNIVSVFSHGRLPSSCYFFDMQLCDFNLQQWLYSPGPATGTTLSKKPEMLWRSLSETRMTDILHVMTDILRGLNYIHSLHEIHRDLKPQNGTYHFPSSSL